MADEIVSGNGQGDHIMGLGLDIKAYVQQLQAALEAYNVFSKQFSKTLSIRIDPQSMNALSNAFGIQMRQAMGMLKGAQKETVQQSAETVKQINSEFKKISGFEAFRELSKKARKAKEDTKKELGELADAAKQAGDRTGDAIAKGVKQGVDGAKAQIGELAAATQKQAQTQAALAKGQVEEAERAARVLAKSIDRYGRKLGTPDGADEIRRLSRVDPTDIPQKIVGRGKDKQAIVDQEGVLVMLRRIKGAYAELTNQTDLYLDRTSSTFERSAAMADKLRDRFEKLGPAAKRLYQQMRQERELLEARERGADIAQIGRTPLGRFGSAEDLTRRIFSESDDGTPQERVIIAQRKFATEERLMRQAEKQAEDEVRAAAKAAEEAEEYRKLRERHNREILTAQKKVRDALDEEAQQARIASEKRAVAGFDRLGRAIAPDASSTEPRLVRRDGTRILPTYDAEAIEREAKAAEAAAKEAEEYAKRRQKQNRDALTAHRKVVEALEAEAQAARIASEKRAEAAFDRVGRLIGTDTVNEPRLVRPDGTRVRPIPPQTTEEIETQRAERARKHQQHIAAVDKNIKAWLAEANSVNKGADRKAAVTAKAVEAAMISATKQAPTNMGTRLVRRTPSGTDTLTDPITQRPVDSAIRLGAIPDSTKNLAKHYADAKKEAQGLFEVQKGIGTSVLQQGTNLIKWLFFYKAVHEVTRLIQNGVRAFVDAGVEYTRQLETQQLALRAILAENFEITDNQGQQLKGMAALSALQGESRRQWGQIQQASLSVVGTTSDLMTLYSGILPFAAQLGADLQQIQDLTKGAAVAASLLDVSFQDARSAMISLLQGRALTRNRLVGALGFTKAEIAAVSGEDRLKLIRSRLEEFILSADEAQETLASLSESFKDFTGIVAAGFTTPFTDLFKEFVKGLTNTNKEWAIFEKTVDGTGLKLKDSLKAFIDFSKTAMMDSLQPLREFGRELMRQSGNDLKQWVIGISEITKAALTVSVVFAKISIAITTFVARNRELLKALAGIAAFGLLVNIVTRLGDAYLTTAKKGGVLASVIRLLTGVSVAANAATAAAGRGVGIWDKLFGSILNVARFAKFTVITGAIAFLTQRFFRLKQEAEAAQATIEAMNKGDVQETIRNAQEGFNSGDPKKMEASSKAIIGVANKVFDRTSRFLGGDISVENAVKAQQKFQKQLKELENQRKDNEEQIAKIITSAPSGDLTKAQSDEVIRLRTENVKIRTQVKEKNTEKTQIFRDLEDTVSILGEQRNIRETIRALDDPARRFFGNMFGETFSTPGAVQLPGIPLPITATALRRGIQLPGKLPAQRGTAAAASLEQEWNKALSTVRAVSAAATAFDEADTPNLTFRGVPDDTDQADRFAGQADAKIRQLEARVAIEKSLHEKAVAHRMETQGEADAAIEKMERDLLAKKIKLYEADAAAYEKYVQNKIKEKKPVDADTAAAQRETNTAKIEEAKKEFAVLVNNQDAAEARRIRAFDDELREGLLGLSKFSAEVFGTVEDTALATFDKNIENIRQKLESLKFNPEQQAIIEAFLKRAAEVRPAVGDMSRIESSIKVNEKRLGVSRDEEGLLMKQFEIGEIGASKYLTRIREIRATQVEILEQLETAFLARAGQKEIGLIGEKDPEKLAQLTIEIAQFRAQAAQARAQIVDILDSARRVEAAIQAWASLTSQFREFLSAADGLEGTNTGLETMIDSLHVASGLLDRIVASSRAFSKIGSTFTQFKALFSDADGGGKIGGSFKALGGLFTSGAKSIGGMFSGGSPTDFVQADVAGVAAKATGEAVTAGQKFAAAIPAIGVGISAALTIATVLFNRGVEKAKKDIEKSFEKINKGLNNGTITLGKAIELAEKERQKLVARYSDSKSGRKALKEMLPQIDDQIEALRQRAADIQKSFDEAFKQLVDLGGNTMKPGPFTDFARELMDLEKFFVEYLDSINTATRGGAAAMAAALEKVGQYYSAFLENAKTRFGEELLSFEGEALSAQERVFSLINTQDGLYKQLQQLAEDRLDLEEAVQEEMERRKDAQNKLNDLAKKELEIRKRIAEIIRQAAEDEMAIRRRGVLEAQLSVAHQKAMEISNVRHRAQEEIDRLKEELAGLQDDIQDETKDNAKKDRDFARRRQAIEDREIDVRKEMRLNEIRLRGANAVAAIQGEIFGMAADEFDLAERQNVLAIAQAEIQVQKWRETQELFNAIIRDAGGFIFEPPPGFPLIKVELGSITIDNRDESTNTFNGPGNGPGGGDRPPRDRDRPTPPGRLPAATDASESGRTARTRGYGDLV